MRTIQRDIVAAIIFSQDGKLFQGMKNPRDGGVYPDCWHLPGGGVHEGEERVSALVREVREETGILIDPKLLELVDDKGRGSAEKVLTESGERVLCEMKFYVYKVMLDQNADDVLVSLEDDLMRYEWTNLTDLKSLKLTPPSVELFKRLGYIT